MYIISAQLREHGSRMPRLIFHALLLSLNIYLLSQYKIQKEMENDSKVGINEKVQNDQSNLELPAFNISKEKKEAQLKETTPNSIEEMDQAKIEKEHHDLEHKHEYISPASDGKGTVGQEPVIDFNLNKEPIKTESTNSVRSENDNQDDRIS